MTHRKVKLNVKHLVDMYWSKCERFGYSFMWTMDSDGEWTCFHLIRNTSEILISRISIWLWSAFYWYFHGHLLIDRCPIGIVDVFSLLFLGSATLRAPSLKSCSAMGSFDVKELVIYAEVRGRPEIFGVVWIGTLNDGRCLKWSCVELEVSAAWKPLSLW